MKSSADKLMALTMVRVVGLAVGTILVISLPPLETHLFPLVLTAASIHFVYFYCLINAYKYGDFSQVYPIARGGAPLLVLVIGLLMLGDQMSVLELAGTLFVSLGVLSLAFFTGKPQLKPLLFALATACCIASYTIVSGIAVRSSQSLWSYVGWLELVTGLAVILFSLARRRSSMLLHVRQNILSGLLAGILSTSAFIASLWAISRVPMAPIAALRETSIIFAVLIGVVFLKEQFGVKRFVASLVVMTGVGCLVMA